MPNTREKLIKLLSEAKSKATEIFCFEKELSYRESLEVEADHLIAGGVTIQRWIPVAERLPEDDLPKDTKRRQIRCLVVTDKGTVKPCVRQRYEKKIDGQWVLCPWEWNKDLFAKPTHWMPLPEPPEGGQCSG